MQLHQLQSNIHFRGGQRVGRGGKRGKTSGRGTKGQKARAGHKIRPAIRDIIKKFPKRRGFKFKSFRKQPIAVSMDVLARHFQGGETVTPEALIKEGVIRTIRGRTPKIKILGGKTKKKFLLKGVSVSRRVRNTASRS